MKKLWLIICTFWFSQLLLSQDPGYNARKVYTANKIKAFDQRNFSPENFFINLSQEFGLSDADDFRQISEREDMSGFTRIKYQHHHHGLPVKGGVYTLHVKNDRVLKSTGNMYPYIFIPKTEGKTKQQITDHAIELFENKLINDQDIENGDGVSWSIKFIEECIMDISFPDFSGEYTKAHTFEISSFDFDEPIKHLVYFNAVTGELINNFSVIQGAATKAKAKTLYYGEQEFITDSISPNRYLLRDLTRGNGIVTLDANTDRDTFVDDDNVWDTFNADRDEVAHDAHYCTTKYYDMMKEFFDWDGLDGNGGELVSVVHVRGRYYVNAFWNGSYTNYGNGDCDRYGPLTTLDVVGHEFAHGWTGSTSGLIYRNESGALNESISDIIGKAVEHYADPDNFNWFIGDKIRLNESVNFFRSLENPHERSDPNFYGGLNWRTGAGDNGGVHTNSGVFNYWFYLLVESGMGVNESGDLFNVESLGWRDALDIVFVTQTGYLTESSNYLDCMYSTLLATEDLFGTNSKQYSNVLEAWKAVGLYPGIDNQDLMLELPNNIIALCKDELTQIDVVIRNVGQDIFTGGKEYIIQFKQNLADLVSETIFIEEDLEVGDSLLYVFQEPIKIESNNAGSFSVELIDPDAISLNNRVNGNIFLSEVDGLDLELINFNFLSSNPCIDENPTRYTYGFRNNGCTIIPSGETLFFDITSDQGDFTIERNIFFDASPLSFYGGSGSILQSEIPDSLGDYTVSIRYPNDLIADNNNLNGVVNIPKSIVEGYREDLEEVNSNLDFWITQISDIYAKDSVLNWNSNRVLAILGTNNIFYRECDEEVGFFTSTNFKTAINFCVNAADLNQPVFEFDLAQITNHQRLDLLPNEDYGVMVRVVTEDMEYPLIYGQLDEVMRKYSFDLTPFYTGELVIEVLTQSGIGELNTDNVFEQRDIALFDDFRLRNKSDIAPDFNEEGYIVYPNPTTSLLKIRNEDPALKYQVVMTNNLGQRIYAKNNIQGIHWIDVSGFSPGVYYATFHETGKIVSTRKVLVLGE